MIVLSPKYKINHFDRMSISNYAPFIQVEYLDYFEFKKDEPIVTKMFDNSMVMNIYLSDENTYDYATRNPYDYIEEDENKEPEYTASNYLFSDALEDIGILSSNPYDGTDVKIGNLENGIPDVNHDNFDDAGISLTTFGTTQSVHATRVMSIYGGISGIASGAELFSAALLDNSRYNCIEWLLEQGVNIINMSNGSDNSMYTSTSSYVDYIVKNSNVTFIASAGNIILGYDYPNIPDIYNEMCSPSTGLNVFSIGFYDNNLNVNFKSPFWDDPFDGELLKPTLIAPGGGLIGIPNIDYKATGSSFSTPIVTGVVALLMDQFDDLKFHPEEVMSILCASTYKVNGQTNTWDVNAGFGSVDYAEAVDTFENTGNYEITSGTASNALVKQLVLQFQQTQV